MKLLNREEFVDGVNLKLVMDDNYDEPFFSEVFNHVKQPVWFVWRGMGKFVHFQLRGVR